MARDGGGGRRRPSRRRGRRWGRVFAADTTIRSLLDPTGEMTWTEYDRGGHFPAMEVPDLLVEDLRAVFAGRWPMDPGAAGSQRA